VFLTDVPAVARLHRANMFASAAVHLPPTLAGQSLQKRENPLKTSAIMRVRVKVIVKVKSPLRFLRFSLDDGT